MLIYNIKRTIAVDMIVSLPNMQLVENPRYLAADFAIQMFIFY